MNDEAAEKIMEWGLTAHPTEAGAADAFRAEMRGRQYGYEETLDAWWWFLAGWKARRDA